MNDKIKNIVNTVMFLLIIVGFFGINLMLPSNELSSSERRALRQRPEISKPSVILDKQFYADVEEYFLDQFLLRDGFRGVKALTAYNLLGLCDNNGIYMQNGHVYKMDFPLNEDNIVRAADRFNLICETYFQDKAMNVYYSVIPDKNYFSRGYLAYDYDRLLQILHENVSGMEYIDIFGVLALNDYYRADLHWKQESLLPAAEKLIASMGKEYLNPGYTQHRLENFKGAYFGQAALPLKPDTLTYLTGGAISGARAYRHAYSQADGAHKIETPVYDPNAFNGVDPYNLFLGGPQMIVEIENPANQGGGELYIFRDSFGSSIAPLLLENYSKITLIDMRYIRHTLYERFISFTPGSDVLFLFSTQILNHSMMLQ
ncbi:MAG: DHHW family protein [Clostridiales bacterium]|nr:DHHW family protein [Clostridiales bacterium]